MITFTNPLFWLAALYFILSICIAWYIPGSHLLAYLRLSTLKNVVLSLLVGMVVWGLQGFLFGFLHLRWLTYLYRARAIWRYSKKLRYK